MFNLASKVWVKIIGALTVIQAGVASVLVYNAAVDGTFIGTKETAIIGTIGSILAVVMGFINKQNAPVASAQNNNAEATSSVKV